VHVEAFKWDFSKMQRDRNCTSLWFWWAWAQINYIQHPTTGIPDAQCRELRAYLPHALAWGKYHMMSLYTLFDAIPTHEPCEGPDNNNLPRFEDKYLALTYMQNSAQAYNVADQRIHAGVITFNSQALLVESERIWTILNDDELKNKFQNVLGYQDNGQYYPISESLAVQITQVKADDIGVVVVRPNIEHEMLAITMGRGGTQELGATFWGQTELSCYDDSQHGIWGMSFITDILIASLELA
jgi:hypothetical protein